MKGEGKRDPGGKSRAERTENGKKHRDDIFHSVRCILNVEEPKEKKDSILK